MLSFPRPSRIAGAGPMRLSSAAAAIVVVMFMGFSAAQSNPDSPQAIRAAVTGVAHHIDAKNWTELKALFAPEVETDYTSLFGGTPITQTDEFLVATQ